MFKQVGSSRTTARSLAAVFAVLLGFVGFGLAANHPGSQDAKPNLYIGAARCKNCHQFAEGGNQYGAWEEAKHSKAFEHQIDPDDGSPYKKIYDPRKWLRQCEQNMAARLDEAFEDLGSKGRSIAKS